MARCKNCGAAIDDMEKRAFCSQCGAAVERPPVILDEYNRPEDYSRASEWEDDIPESRAGESFGGAEARREEKESRSCRGERRPQGRELAFSLFSYLGFFIIIPLGSLSSLSDYARFHVNQGLTLSLASLFLGILKIILKESYPAFSFPALAGFIPSLQTLIAVLSLYGVYNAVTGRKKRLPFIGNIDIIKPRSL